MRSSRERRLRRETLPAPLGDGNDRLRLIVWCARSDVRAVGSDKCAQFCIDVGLPEQVQITDFQVAITFPGDYPHLSCFMP